VPMAPRSPNFWTRIRSVFRPTQAVALGWDEPTPSVPTAEGYERTSASGTQYGYGQITGYERNTALTSEQWCHDAEDMLRRDGVVRLAVEGYLQTIRSATWKFVAADDSPRAEYYRAFFADMWSRMRYGWQDQQLSYLSRYALAPGFRYAEQIDCVRRSSVDGQLRTMVDFFADCEPSAHYRWVSDDGGRTLSAVQQIDRGATYGGIIDSSGNPLSVSHMPVTPANRLLLLTHGFTGTNWAGDGGIMRSVWADWKDKTAAKDARAIGLNRFAAPVPHVKTDRMGMINAGYSPDEIAQASDAAFASASQWAVGGATAIQSDTLINIDFIGGVFDASQCNDTIRQSNDEIVSGLLQPFLAMGLGDTTGSRALSTQSASHFDVWVENVADNIASQINGDDRPGGGVVGRIMKANGWESEMHLAPKIAHSGLDTDAFNELVGVLSAWKSTGLLRHKALIRPILDRMGIEYTDAELDAISKDVSDGQEQASVVATDEGTGREAPAGRPGPGRPGLEGGAEDPEPNRKPRTVKP